MFQPRILLALLAQGCATVPTSHVVNDTAIQNGSILILTCEGSGPSLDLARRSALDSCRQSAADLASQALESRTLLVETNTQGAYHSEISKRATIEMNYRIEKESYEESNGSFKDHVRCKFDLNKSKIVPIPTNTQATYAQGENRHIIISTIPSCDDVLITGDTPRATHCDQNPITLFVKPTDQELIIRAKNRIPKHIPLQNVPRAMEVYLEQM